MERELEKLFNSFRWFSFQIELIGRIHRNKTKTLEVMQAVIEAVSFKTWPKGLPADLPVPVFHFKNRKFNFTLNKNDPIKAEIMFFRTPLKLVKEWRNNLIGYFNEKDNQRTFILHRMSEEKHIVFAKEIEQYDKFPKAGEICLDFLSPLPFKPEKGKHRNFIDSKMLLKGFENRIRSLFKINVDLNYLSNDFSLIPCYWNYTEIKHKSFSQPGNTQFINGCFGKLYLKGNIKKIYPWIVLASYIHFGTKLSNSQGYFRILKDSPPYFSSLFPDRRSIIAIIKTITEQYDTALEELTREKLHPFDEKIFANMLIDELQSGTYRPTPNKAFKIKKLDGNERIVEELDTKDLIISKYLLKLLTKPFDVLFEKESIGYRKGVSRERAGEIIESSIKEGYQYVAESDIESFFSQVDHERLIEIIQKHLPSGDTLIMNIIKTILRNGFILNKKYFERTNGLAQGCPLSPLFENLYLDSFDEFIKSEKHRFVRYGDDFIILCKTEENAKRIISESSRYLSAIGLKLKKEKTSITHVSKGFSFLGMTFDSGGIVRGKNLDYHKLLKKPLYVTEPYVFLSLFGDAINVKKNRKTLATIPVRRISEIMIMEKSVFSTQLIKRCTESNIPFTITLNNGYYITTIKPDSKRFFDVSFLHYYKFSNLSETDKTMIAGNFAANKLNNYITLFRQRYKKGNNLCINRLQKIIDDIKSSIDINEILGFEGWGTRIIYENLNKLIKHKSFYIKKRVRKKPDKINSLLNFGYYLLFSRINATIRALCLNPYLGFLHSPKNNFESLVCDIQELFRARIDRLIIRMINLGIITDRDFSDDINGSYLNRDGVQKYIKNFEEEMNKNNSKKLSLKEEIYVQITILKDWTENNRSLSFYKWEI